MPLPYKFDCIMYQYSSELCGRCREPRAVIAAYVNGTRSPPILLCANCAQKDEFDASVHKN